MRKWKRYRDERDQVVALLEWILYHLGDPAEKRARESIARRALSEFKHK